MKVEESDEDFIRRIRPAVEAIGSRLAAPPQAPPGSTATCTLYRIFDAEGALLYVGISEQGSERWRQHRAEKPWWTSVVAASIEHYASRSDGEQAERRAIASEHPRYNVVHNRS